jgi:hypothetical protein
MSDHLLQSAICRLGILLGNRLDADFAETYLRRVESRVSLVDGRLAVADITAADPLQALVDEVLAKAPKAAFLTYADADPTVPRSAHYLDILRAKLAEQRAKDQAVLTPVGPITRGSRE